MNLYTFSVKAATMPSLKQHVESVLLSRPDVKVLGVQFHTPDVYEFHDGKLHLATRSWIEVSLYTDQPLPAGATVELEQAMGAVEICQEADTPAVQMPLVQQEQPKVEPPAEIANDGWPRFFKLVPVIHIENAH